MDNSRAALREILEGREGGATFLVLARYYQVSPGSKLHASPHCTSLKSWQPRPAAVRLTAVPRSSALCSHCRDCAPGGAESYLEALGDVMLLEEHLDGSRQFSDSVEEHAAGLLRLWEDADGEALPAALAERGERARRALEARVRELHGLHRDQVAALALRCGLEVVVAERYRDPLRGGLDQITALEAWKSEVVTGGLEGAYQRALGADREAVRAALGARREEIEGCATAVEELLRAEPTVVVWRSCPGGWCYPADEAIVAASVGEVAFVGGIHVSRAPLAAALWLGMSSDERGGMIEAARIPDAAAAEILASGALPRGSLEVLEGLLAERGRDLGTAVSLAVLTTALAA